MAMILEPAGFMTEIVAILLLGPPSVVGLRALEQLVGKEGGIRL